jgi:hypothetical protein
MTSIARHIAEAQSHRERLSTPEYRERLREIEAKRREQEPKPRKETAE